MSETHDDERGEVLKASSVGRERIQVGMTVVGVDGDLIGKVKEVRQNDFLVDRPLARDLVVPFGFVLEAQNEYERIRGGPSGPTEVVLTISASRVDDQGWSQA